MSSPWTVQKCLKDTQSKGAVKNSTSNQTCWQAHTADFDASGAPATAFAGRGDTKQLPCQIHRRTLKILLNCPVSTKRMHISTFRIFPLRPNRPLMSCPIRPRNHACRSPKASACRWQILITVFPSHSPSTSKVPAQSTTYVSVSTPKASFLTIVKWFSSIRPLRLAAV